MVKISKRLETVASLVTQGGVLADVGTDHGYVPIYLLQQHRIARAIAMDIGIGPLERAKEHIVMYGMEQYIETRLSDGVAALAPEEVDSIVIAGMGGGLVIHILEDGESVCRAAKELILQPQSELEKVRDYLNRAGYVTMAEDMVFEDGKYYPMMRVRYDAAETSESRLEDSAEPSQSRLEDSAEPSQSDEYFVFCRYGRGLLAQRHPVLQEYLNRERQILEQILGNLKNQEKTGQITARISEVEENLRLNKKAGEFYEQ